jgi:hypothetical protein
VTNNEQDQQRIDAYPRGSVVRVKDPESFIPSVASKLRDRLGEVTGHTFPYGNPVVCFPAIGRRQELRQPFSAGILSNLEIVNDEAVIAPWREAVRQTAERAATRKKKVASKPKPATP